MKGWEKVFDTDKRYQAEIVKDVLMEKGITAVVINKKDSSYLVFGRCEVHVAREDVLRAINMIENDIKFEEI